MAKIKADDITVSLRERIAASEWHASQTLPNERALSEHYGVARNTIRRAISTLADEGILTRHVGRGTIINETADRSSGDLSAIVQKLQDTSPFDVMNMRLIIEPQATAAAATNASEAELKMLADIHDKTVEVTDMVDFELLDMAFHQQIFSATRNDFLQDLNEILSIVRQRRSVIAIRRSSFTETRRVECVDQHRVILDALFDRDPTAAAEAMKLHLSVRSRNLFGGVGHAAPAAPGPEDSAPQPDDETQSLMNVMGRIAGSSPLDVMNVRLIVEPTAAAVSAANARPTDLIAIRNAHELATASLEIEPFEAWDGEFHKRVFESTRNDFLTTLHDILKAIRTRKSWLDMKRRNFSDARRQKYCQEHAAIYQAIADRDPTRAAQAMREHMMTIQNNLF
jgi:DNA-binding FadR family transcriptional regulator